MISICFRTDWTICSRETVKLLSRVSEEDLRKLRAGQQFPRSSPLYLGIVADCSPSSHEITVSLPNCCRLGGMVNFTLPSTTSEMISISTSQTFRSWVVIFHHRRPVACLSLNLYDTPGLAPRMNVLFWGPGDFPVSYSNRDTLWNAWNRHSGSFMVDTGILLSNME